MPSGAEGSLRLDLRRLVALILKSNGLPAGTERRAPSTAHLKIVPKDGSRRSRPTAWRVVGCLSKSGIDWVLTNATAP
jgi:hypothetical protein